MTVINFLSDLSSTQIFDISRSNHQQMNSYIKSDMVDQSIIPVPDKEPLSNWIIITTGNEELRI